MSMQKLILVAGASTAAALARAGEDIHCVGARAHLLKYDVAGEENDGSSMNGIERALISLEAAHQLDHKCVGAPLHLGKGPAGDKQFCYGVNQNSDCSGANISSFPLENGAFDCKDCYVSAQADVFYKLNYSMTGFHSAQVGLQDVHVKASASLHKFLKGSTTAFKGSHELMGGGNITVIDKLVGCPACVKVKIDVAMPTTLDYELDLAGQADITVGGTVDMHLADRWAKYDSKDGWTHPATFKRTVTAAPILDISNVQATAKLNLGLRTSLQVNLDDIMWFHLNLGPKLPLTGSASGSIFPPFHGDKFCLKGDAELNISHEADLHWNFAVWHAKKHWGPQDDYQWKKDGILNYCKTVKAETTETITV